MSDSVRPHRQQPTRLPRPWDSPGKNTGVGCHFLFQCMKVKSESEVSQSCPTLHDPMDCSLPGSSIHGILQARVLEWGAIAFSDPYVRMQQKTNCWWAQWHGWISKTSCRAKSKSQKVTYSMTLYDKMYLWRGQVMTTGMENRLVMSRIYEWGECLTKKGQHEAIWKCSISWLWLNKSIHRLKFMELYTRIFFLLNIYIFLRNCAEIKFLPCQISKNFKVWHNILVARLEEIGTFICCWKMCRLVEAI